MNETTYLAEVNARIASELALDSEGLTDVVLAKLERAATGAVVRLTAIEANAIRCSSMWMGGYVLLGSTQIGISEKNSAFRI